MLKGIYFPGHRVDVDGLTARVWGWKLNAGAREKEATSNAIVPLSLVHLYFARTRLCLLKCTPAAYWHRLTCSIPVVRKTPFIQ